MEDQTKEIVFVDIETAGVKFDHPIATDDAIVTAA